MQVIFNLPTLAAAADALLKTGIIFNNVLCPLINGNQYRRGVHHYFMLGNSDVAYWTEGLNSLIIHDTPRFWGESILQDAKAKEHLTSGGK